MNNQRDYLLADDANRNFFKHVKNFSKFEKSEQFDVRSILPNKSDKEVADALADYFIKVSREFSPLQPGEIPARKPSSGRRIPIHQVAARLFL